MRGCEGLTENNSVLTGLGLMRGGMCFPKNEERSSKIGEGTKEGAPSKIEMENGPRNSTREGTSW